VIFVTFVVFVLLVVHDGRTGTSVAVWIAPGSACDNRLVAPMIGGVNGSSSIWISVGIVAIMVGVAVVARTRRKSRIDLGTVSERWTAEHRAGPSTE
jgi:hypothetical protein